MESFKGKKKVKLLETEWKSSYQGLGETRTGREKGTNFSAVRWRRMSENLMYNMNIVDNTINTLYTKCSYQNKQKIPRVRFCKFQDNKLF